MDTTLTQPQAWARWKEAKQVAVLATFEDSATGTRVKEFCQRLGRHLGRQCRLVEHVWLFSTFRLPELQQIAAEEAATSDVVVISVHQAQSLPDEVKGWIGLWLQRKGNRTAILLALLDPVYEGHPSPVQVYLQDIASQGHMQFLMESSEPSNTHWHTA